MTPTIKPDWVKIKPIELEKIVIDLAKQKETPSKIGMILRDQHGVPKSKVFGKKITQIIKEAKISHKTDKDIISKKIEKIKAHVAKNKQDHSASRSLTKNLWALNKIDKQS